MASSALNRSINNTAISPATVFWFLGVSFRQLKSLTTLLKCQSEPWQSISVSLAGDASVCSLSYAFELSGSLTILNFATMEAIFLSASSMSTGLL